VTVRIAAFVFPAASLAVTVSTLTPLSKVMPFALQLVVPLAVPLPPRLLLQVTCVTPTLSEAVPPRFTELAEVENVGLVVGEVMATEGAVVSRGV
jgi:hypothetical protein